MAEKYSYDITDFLNDKVNIPKLSLEINDSTSLVSAELDYINTDVNVCDIWFTSALSPIDSTANLPDIVAVHDGEPIPPTSIEEFIDERAVVVDPLTNLSGDFYDMQILSNRREIHNDTENPIYHSSITPIVGPLGWGVDHANRILNDEIIHGKQGWHNLEVQAATYQKPHDLLFYYGWLNSFNSGTNGWDNEKVAQDMAKYCAVIFGDGVQDPSHGDYANTSVIIPRLQALNPICKIFGYVTTNQTIGDFETKVDQWNTLGVNGIFMDESGYDFGKTRTEFNERVTYIHGRSSSSLAFANAWNLDHILGTVNDASYPNTTYNSGLVESDLDYNDWVLLESFGIGLAYTGTDGYETGSQWASRTVKALGHRQTYAINIAGVGTIANADVHGDDKFLFGYIGALMNSLEAYGSSDTNYGSSSAAVNFWTRPNTANIGRVYNINPSILVDVGDSDVYHRYIDVAKFTLDFSVSAQLATLTKYIDDTGEHFDAYNTTTPTVTGTWTDVPLDDWHVRSPAFELTKGQAEVLYQGPNKVIEIHADVSIDVSAGNQSSQSEIQLVVDTGSGYTALAGTLRKMYNDSATHGGGSASITKQIYMQAGDKIKIQARLISGSSTLVLVANGCTLSMKC